MLYEVITHVVFQFAYTHVSFVPSWSNPLWDLFECELQSEHDQVINLLYMFIDRLPVANFTWNQPIVQDGDFTHLWLMLKGRRWLRFWAIMCSAWGSFWVSSWGFGLIIGISTGVITSYSIHYTKLYEVLPAAR